MLSKLYIKDPSTRGYFEVQLDQNSQAKIQLGVKSFASLVEGKTNIAFFTLNLPINYNINQQALRTAIDHNFEPGQDITGQKLEAALEIGWMVFEGEILFNGYDKTRGFYNMRTQFISGIQSLTSRLPEYVRDLPFGRFEFTAANIASYLAANYNKPFDGNNELYWCEKYYQGNQQSNSYRTDSDVKPDMHMAAITSAMSRHLGQQLKSQFFQTVFYRNILHPFVGENLVRALYVEAELLSDYVISSGIDTVDLSSPPWNVTFDPNGMILFGFESVLLLSDWDKATLEVEADFDVAASATNPVAPFYLSGQNLVVQDQISMQAGQNNTFTLKGVYFGTGAAVTTRRPYFLIAGPCTIQAGSKIRIYFTAPSVAEGALWDNSSVIPADLKTIDYITGITGLFNLVWFYNPFIDEAIVEPKWSYQCPMTGELGDGFYRNIAYVDDWSDKLDCVEESADFLVNTDAQREFVLAFQEDDSDGFVNDELLYAFEITLSGKYKAGQKTNRNEIFAPTQSGAMNPNYAVAATLQVPILVNDVESLAVITNEKYYDFEMRILYKPGHYARAGYYLNGSIQSEMYPAHHRAVLDGSILVPSVSGQLIINLGYDDFAGVKGLANTFYPTDIAILNRGFRKKIKGLLSLSEFLDLERLFRHLKYVNTKNGVGLYVLEQIALPIGRRDIVEVELIFVPQE